MNIDIKSNNLENNEAEPVVETKEIEDSINSEENIEVVENTSVEEAISEENNLETSENIETSEDLESSLENNLYHVDKLEDIEEPTFQMPENSSLASDIDSSVINSVEPEAPILEKDEKEKVVGYNPASNALIEKSKNNKFVSKIKEKISAIRISLVIFKTNFKNFVSEVKEAGQELYDSYSFTFDTKNERKNTKLTEDNIKDTSNSKDFNASENELIEKNELTTNAETLLDNKIVEEKKESLNTVDKENIVSEPNLMEELDSYTPDENETGLNNNIEYEPADSVTIGEDGAEEDLFIRNLEHEYFGNEEPSMGRSR